VRTLRIAPALAAGTWHAGHDASGCVRVELDGPGRDVRVSLADDWRRTLGSERLGEAVVAAHGDAVVARMTAWALESALPAPVPYDEPGAEQVVTVQDAHRELAVFRRRLAELRAAPVTVEAAGTVQVMVRDGRPSGARITRPDATDAELASALAAGLRAALAVVAEQPAAALARCPALRAVLGSSRLPLPFGL
jgi:hypothetical protein